MITKNRVRSIPRKRYTDAFDSHIEHLMFKVLTKCLKIVMGHCNQLCTCRSWFLFPSKEDQLTYLQTRSEQIIQYFAASIFAHAMSQDLHFLPGFHQPLCDKPSVPLTIGLATRRAEENQGVLCTVQEFPSTTTPLEFWAGWTYFKTEEYIRYIYMYINYWLLIYIYIHIRI